MNWDYENRRQGAGFRFGSEVGLSYFHAMDPFVDAEGVIVEINDDRFLVKFPQIVNSDYFLASEEQECWWYPIAEYLRIQREDKLNELGI